MLLSLIIGIIVAIYGIVDLVNMAIIVGIVYLIVGLALIWIAYAVVGLPSSTKAAP